MPSCTICGVSFGKSTQVRAHIQGSAGEHAGIGYNEADEFISEAPVDVDEDAPEADPDAGPDADPPSSPSKDEGLGVPQKASRPSKDDDPRCPECGSNRWFDASQHTDYEFGCAECSTGSSWQVFDA